MFDTSLKLSLFSVFSVFSVTVFFYPVAYFLDLFYSFFDDCELFCHTEVEGEIEYPILSFALWSFFLNRVKV